MGDSQYVLITKFVFSGVIFNRLINNKISAINIVEKYAKLPSILKPKGFKPL